MKLRNRFDHADKIRIWNEHQYCVLCKSNQNCSLHHIEGCKEKADASIYNSSMLCYACHKEADSHNTASPLSRAFQKKLRDYTFSLIQKQGYTNKPIDDKYFNKNRTS